MNVVLFIFSIYLVSQYRGKLDESAAGVVRTVLEKIASDQLAGTHPSMDTTIYYMNILYQNQIKYVMQ